MENQALQIPSDQSSQATTPDQSSPKQKVKQSRIYNCDWFPITTSPWIASIAFIFQIFLPIHLLDSYAENAGRIFGNTDSFKMISPFVGQGGVETVAYVLSAVLAVLSVLTLFFNKSEEEEGYKYLLGWMGNKMFPVLRYIIDLNQAIAAIFMIRTPTLGILFAVASIINLTISFFCQNYSLRKDYLCCKSMQYLLLWKILLILSYTISSLTYYITDSQLSLLILLSIQFVLMLILFTTYFIFGFLIYRHNNIQIILLFMLSLFFVASSANLSDAFLTVITGVFVPDRNLVMMGYYWVMVVVMAYCIWSRIKKEGTNLDNQDPVRKIYFIFNKIQNSSQNINDDCQIRGIIRHHMSHPCKNQQCFTNKDIQSYYDSKKNKYCYPNKINQGKTSFVKFIAKCLYEQELDRDKWNNTDLMVDYVEFYYMKLKNLFQVCKLLARIEKKFLTPFQKLKLIRLRRVMLEENRKLNEELYNGSLDTENLIASQNKFDQIQIQIKELQARNLQFWKYIQNYQVNLSVMIGILKPNFGLVEKINNNWKCIASYFEIQKVWKFMFACYTLYFRNQKLKPQLIEEFGQSVQEDELFLSDSLHIDKTCEPSKLYVSKMIFEPDVCSIHITHDQEKPVIKSVSRYFERMLGFQSKQVIESPLDILMTPCFRNIHKTTFLKWAGEGMASKQNNYDIKKIFPLKKNGYIISAFKFYKQFLCIDKQLQYVGMIKKNKEEESVIILNENYEIEGMSQILAMKLELSYKKYQDLVGLNILTFIPSLIQYSKFDREKEDNNINNDDIGASLRNFTLQKNYITHELGEKSREKRGVISEKKEFTKSNLRFNIPESLQEVRQAYSIQDGEDSSHFMPRIVRSCKTVKDSEKVKKFKVEIEARLMKVQKKYEYLELYIREVQSEQKKQSKKSQRVVSSQAKKNEIDQSSFKQQQFNKFFQNSHNSQNISLAFTDNIFIKEDNNQPVQMISYVNSITLYVRIIFVFFFAFLVSSLLFEYSNYSDYRENSEKTYAMVELQLKVLMLDSKYYSQILNINGAKLTVIELTSQLRDIREQNIQFKKSILDSKINQFQQYKFFENNRWTTSDQIDLLDKLYQTIIQLQFTFKTQKIVKVNIRQQFSTIVSPPIQQLTTNCRLRISAAFDDIYQKIQTKNYIYLAVGLVLLIVGFMLVLSKLIKISSSFISLVQIFTQFSQSDLKKIIRYYINLDHLFVHLNTKYDLLKENDISGKYLNERFRPQSSFNASYSHKERQTLLEEDAIANDEGQQIDNANLNKKVKKVVIGKQLTNLKIRPIIYVVVFLIIYGMSLFGLNMYTSIINKQVIEFKDAGNEIFQFYSSVNLYYIAMKDRALLQDAFNWAAFQSFSERLEDMKKLQFKDENKVYGDFLKERNQVMFSNICNSHQSVYAAVGYTYEQCKDMAENNFEHGIQSTIFFMIGNVDQYRTSSSYVLDPSLMQNMETGVQICNLFLEFLLQKWLSTFKAYIVTIERNIIIICSCLFVVQIIIYIFFVEVLIVGNLKDKFLFFRKVYNNMMPDFLVTKQKIIKAKLEVEGFLKK